VTDVLDDQSQGIREDRCRLLQRDSVLPRVQVGLALIPNNAND
jgi:hypothetical protein